VNGAVTGNANCQKNMQADPGLCTPGATTGSQLTRITQTTPGLCPWTQVVGNFSEVLWLDGIYRYSWSCNGSQVGGFCTASHTPTASTAFDLSIKKFVNGLDAQNAWAAVTVWTSTGFTYTLQIKNEGPVASTGTTTVTDTLPAWVTLVSVPNVAPWTCNVAGNSFNCATTSSIASGATYPTITVNALTTTATGTITNIGNVANPNDTNALNNSDPAVIAVGVSATAFDLSIKKFVNGLDAQNAWAAVTVWTSTGFTYTLQIKNEGPVASTGTTTVTDTLPAW
jgi:hypothetical protein